MQRQILGLLISETTGVVRENVVVVGHCCESGDLLPCAAGDPEKLAPRKMEMAETGDLVASNKGESGAAWGFKTSFSEWPLQAYPFAFEFTCAE